MRRKNVRMEKNRRTFQFEWKTSFVYSDSSLNNIHYTSVNTRHRYYCVARFVSSNVISSSLCLKCQDEIHVSRMNVIRCARKSLMLLIFLVFFMFLQQKQIIAAFDVLVIIGLKIRDFSSQENINNRMWATHQIHIYIYIYIVMQKHGRNTTFSVHISQTLTQRVWKWVCSACR